MRRKRFTEEQIIGILKEAEVGCPEASTLGHGSVTAAYAARTLLRGAYRRMEPKPFDLVQEGPIADIEKSRCVHAIPVGLLKREEDDPTLGRLRSCPGDLFEGDPAIPELPGNLLIIAGQHHSLDHLSPVPEDSEAFNTGGRCAVTLLRGCAHVKASRRRYFIGVSANMKCKLATILARITELATNIVPWRRFCTARL